MTNADWWPRVVQARTPREDLLPQRVCAFRKDGHEAAIDLTPLRAANRGRVFRRRKSPRSLTAMRILSPFTGSRL